MDIPELAKKIFSDSPKPENSIYISFENLGNTRDLFEALSFLFTEGMKIKHSSEDGKVNINMLSYTDIYRFKLYFSSIGIKFNYHKFHIKQLESLENESLKSSNINIKYECHLPITQEELDTVYTERLTKELLIDHKKVNSNVLSDYKYQFRVDDNIYIIYYEFL